MRPNLLAVGIELVTAPARVAVSTLAAAVEADREAWVPTTADEIEPETWDSLYV